MAPDAEPVPLPATGFAPLTQTMLPVGDGHELYVETVGRADGIPAVYLHGGPGSGCQPDHRKFFDPSRYRAVLFDQRGAGRSLPKGSREANTTPHLVADMELIRQNLGIERWLVVGGSWGATLALAYGQTHPEHVSGIVLRATFLGTREELNWAFVEGLSRFYPALHDDFLSLLTENERTRPLEAYFARIHSPDPQIAGPATRAYADTERILSESAPAQTRLDFTSINNLSRPLPATGLMEAHYFANDSFMAPGQLMANAGRLAGIPGIIIQGRYDLLCPPKTAAALAARWPDAQLRIIDRAGHQITEPGITEALKAAIAEFAARLG
ncbi:MAG: Proline iminopeptidase [Hyphomicrobiales bacterium]|nr:Proline iminopeptidase [Hyphomicrobiales bacterium]